MTVEPTCHLRFVKRRVGANVVRILQQKWEDDIKGLEEWRDVELADERATTRGIPSQEA